MNFDDAASAAVTAPLSSLSLAATRVSVEKARSASRTLIVPSALERRAENGSSSGERPHCVLMLIRPTLADSRSTSGAAVPLKTQTALRCFFVLQGLMCVGAACSSTAFLAYVACAAVGLAVIAQTDPAWW